MAPRIMSRDAIGSLQMQLDIPGAHLDEEEEALKQSDLVPSGRSVIDPIAYAALTASMLRKRGTEKKP